MKKKYLVYIQRVARAFRVLFYPDLVFERGTYLLALPTPGLVRVAERVGFSIGQNNAV